MIPQKVKVASAERGVVVLERKAPAAPVLKAPDQNKLPRRGTNFSVTLHVGTFAGVMNEHISKRAITLRKQTDPGLG